MNAAPAFVNPEPSCADDSNVFDVNFQKQQQIPSVTALHEEQKKQIENVMETLQENVQYNQQGGFVIEFIVGTGILHVIGSIYAVFLAYQCNLTWNWIELVAALVFPYLYIPYAYYSKECSSEVLIPTLIQVFQFTGDIIGYLISAIPSILTLAVSLITLYYILKIEDKVNTSE